MCAFRRLRGGTINNNDLSKASAPQNDISTHAGHILLECFRLILIRGKIF